MGMTSIESVQKRKTREFPFLCVDDFTKDIFHARALEAAFEIGIIDYLLTVGNVTVDAFWEACKGEDRALHLLLNLLIGNNVVRRHERQIMLTDDFKKALRFRDLLEIRLQIASLAAHDVIDYFSDLVMNRDAFMRKARFIGLFAYDRCYGSREEDYRLTRQWMRITTVLTKYEAEVCMQYVDFGQYRRILDIGGNSGEFVLQICKKNPDIQAVVYDLPMVCEVGMNHVRSETEFGRIAFMKGNALTDDIPDGFDLIIFKSMLHDWPDREVSLLIEKAGRSLRSGGSLLIFERQHIDGDETTLPYAIMPFLLFFHCFRSPSVYEKQLEANGFQDIETRRIDLEMPFLMVTGRKGAEEA